MAETAQNPPRKRSTSDPPPAAARLSTTTCRPSAPKMIRQRREITDCCSTPPCDPSLVTNARPLVRPALTGRRPGQRIPFHLVDRSPARFTVVRLAGQPAVLVVSSADQERADFGSEVNMKFLKTADSELLLRLASARPTSTVTGNSLLMTELILIPLMKRLCLPPSDTAMMA